MDDPKWKNRVSVWNCACLGLLTSVLVVLSTDQWCHPSGGTMMTGAVQRKEAAISTRMSGGIDPKSWCPQAICRDSALCRPCERRFLIIVTSGRTASTTLTWMMDLLPGVRMSGENNNVIQTMKSALQRTLRHPFKLELPKGQEKGAWGHNPIPYGSFACPTQAIIETLNPPPLRQEPNGTQQQQDDIVGFKTIRLFRNNTMAHVPGIVHFLKEHFPCARYLVNYRSDVLAQAKSQAKNLPAYRNQDLGEGVALVQAETDRLRLFHHFMGNGTAYLLDSSEWTRNVTILNNAIKWLGFHSNCAFPRVLQWDMKAQKQPQKEGAEAAEFKMDSTCRYLKSAE
mmetsp:Transcript_15651/g.43165  ORF Transcript_15651/g.43165 Transcript_15651/m.43165 type:complete len:341 (-) Transcript_15651:1908-2930(-)